MTEFHSPLGASGASRAVQHPGMTLRDYFAGQALASFPPAEFKRVRSLREVAVSAYFIADCMLELREKPRG